MSKNTSVALGEHFAGFVEQQVTDGRFGNVSEVVRAGLRLLEEHETKHAALRVAIQEGIDSGEPEKFDLEQFLKRKRSARKAP
jgi:antitoxin ParD1/3/4